VDSARQVIALINRRNDHGLTALTGNEVVVDADQAEIPVGMDGETVLMPTPVRCTVRPGALTVLVPRNRPGNRAARAALDPARLGQLASFRPVPVAAQQRIKVNEGDGVSSRPAAGRLVLDEADSDVADGGGPQRGLADNQEGDDESEGSAAGRRW
jgi:hypothetical protein